MNTTRRMPSGFYPAVPLFVVMSALCVHGVSAAIGGIEGHARYPMVDGYPGLGYVELYEYNVWVCRQGDETALPFRTGAPPEAAIRYNGFFQFPKFADGNYTLILAQPLFFARSRIIPHVAIENGQWVQQHIEPAFDYSYGPNGGVGSRVGISMASDLCCARQEYYTDQGSACGNCRQKPPHLSSCG
ncbi:MAG: hypothetical protein ACOX52_21585 [Verrucomicrobiota bacterium]